MGSLYRSLVICISAMRRTLADRALLVLTAASVAAAGAAASPSAPLVRVDDGLLQGRTVAGVNEFLGIPYAAPPTGSLRWTPPQAPAAWSGTRDASACIAPPHIALASFFQPPLPLQLDVMCIYLSSLGAMIRIDAPLCSGWHGNGG